MNRKQIEKLTLWIEALLSGDYQQGRGRLYDPKTECHCVLGVACEVVGVPKFFGRYYFGFEADALDTFLAKDFVPPRWIRDTFGVGPFGFAAKNDQGWTFAELAAYLVSFLPNGEDKTELQSFINKVLKSEQRLRELESV